MTLTGQWEKGELEEHKKYYCKTEWSEDIFQARCYNKDTKGEWWVLENEKYRYNNIYHTKDIEVLAPVPSYKKWQELKSHDEKATIKLGEKCIENQQLKDLLKRCRDFINYEVPDHCIDDVLLDKIDNAIGEKK